jgi:ligand-binding sensor domain-containing protein
LKDYVAVTIDPLNSDHVYAGSWWRGVTEFKDNAIAQIYSLGNSSLLPNMIEGAPVVKVGGMDFDNENNLWMTNSGAESILSVKRALGSTGLPWEAFNLGSATTGIDVRKIIVDSYDQKWIIPKTSQSNPNYIFVFNEKNDPGKQVRGLKSGAGYGNLPGTSVYAIAEDLDGVIWVGTDEGIAVFYSPQNIFTNENSDAQQILVNIDGYVQYLLETEIVKSIAIDGANRKWFGTERAGVFLLSADGTQQIEHFTEDNSPLFSNNITSIAINDLTGEVFIGTAKGLICYKGTATDGGDTNTNVYAYPNPVRPGYNGPIAIKGLVTDANVKITDIRGSVIYETIAEGGQAIWNGYSFDGRKANTGVYLVFITNSDGSEKMVTKILFVN